jgi:hypothetical protein
MDREGEGAMAPADRGTRRPAAWTPAARTVSRHGTTCAALTRCWTGSSLPSGSTLGLTAHGHTRDRVVDRQQEALRIAGPWPPCRSLASAYLFQSAFQP